MLDNSAKHIVDLGAPNAPLPSEVSKDTDILIVSSNWTFTREDTLSGN